MLRKTTQSMRGAFFKPVSTVKIGGRFWQQPWLTLPSLPESEKEIVNAYKNDMKRFEKSRAELDLILKNSLKIGMQHLKTAKLSEAKKCFDKIITLLSDQNLDMLTELEKEIVANACTQKANIMAVGSEKDEEIALQYLEQALSILPNFEEALLTKRAILANRISPEFVEYDVDCQIDRHKP